MATNTFDVIVVGVGGMGSAACFHLARRGRRVLGLERFDIPHDLGSSSGSSRVIRLAYNEGSFYVPLVQRAYELWHELESVARERLLVTTGGVDLGRPDSAEMRGVQAVMAEHQIPFDAMDAAGVRRQFPALQPPDDHIGVYQADTGFLLPERCVIASVDAALSIGADIRAREQVTRWSAQRDHVEVWTDRDHYIAGRLVLTAGPWLPALFPEIAARITVERQAQGWFRPLEALNFEVGRMPVFIHHLDDRIVYYGLPQHGRPGVKVCQHHHGTTVNPESVDRSPSRADEEAIRAYIRRFLPGANGATLAMKVCLYTNTPDHHFIVDRHPRHPEVIVAGGFSGHGFKFASVVGEIAADLATEGRTRHSIGAFSIGRLLT